MRMKLQVIKMKDPMIDTVFLQNYFEECVKEECRDDQSRQHLPIFKITDQNNRNGTRVKFIFKLDGHEKCKKRYFNNSRDLKIADCVIVMKHRDEQYCFIIELKSGNSKKKINALQQIVDTYTRLEELELQYRHKMKEKKKRGEEKTEITKANLRSFIYLKKTSSKLVASLKQHKEKYGGKPYFVYTIKPENLRGKNLEEAVSFILKKTN